MSAEWLVEVNNWLGASVKSIAAICTVYESEVEEGLEC